MAICRYCVASSFFSFECKKEPSSQFLNCGTSRNSPDLLFPVFYSNLAYCGLIKNIRRKIVFLFYINIQNFINLNSLPNKKLSENGNAPLKAALTTNRSCYYATVKILGKWQRILLLIRLKLLIFVIKSVIINLHSVQDNRQVL